MSTQGNETLKAAAAFWRGGSPEIGGNKLPVSFDGQIKDILDKMKLTSLKISFSDIRKDFVIESQESFDTYTGNTLSEAFGSLLVDKNMNQDLVDPEFMNELGKVIEKKRIVVILIKSEMYPVELALSGGKKRKATDKETGISFTVNTSYSAPSNTDKNFGYRDYLGALVRVCKR